MFLKPQARENARALVGAAALGSLVGLTIGGAYLAGGLARSTVVHAEIQRLAGAASGGFSDTALRAATGDEDAAVLAIAKTHDPVLPDPSADHDRQVAALVDRLEARQAARRGAQPLLAQAETPKPIARAVQPLVRVSAREFHLRGALEQSRDLECLTQAVYYEARGEPISGQKAVAQVIMNRVRAPSFPKTVCGVVFQGAGHGSCQFSFACDGQPRHPLENAAWRRSESVAAEALGGQVMEEVGDATHFHAAGGASTWSQGLMKVAQIGAHVFYRFSRRGEHGPSVGGEAAHAPLFASLSLAPSGSGKAESPAKLIASASQAVEAAASHAASVVETAAIKAAGVAEPRPTAPAPAEAPARPSAEEAPKPAQAPAS